MGYPAPRGRSAAELRALAEEIARRDKAHDRFDSEQLAELVFDLKVHQIELQMQNEELARAHDDLEAITDQFADLYHNAPVGYVSSDEMGNVLQANKMLAVMLQAPLAEIAEKRLAPWCVEQDSFYRHCRSVINHDSASCSEDMEFRRSDGTILQARVTSCLKEPRDGGKRHIRSIIADMTELRRLEHQVQAMDRLKSIGALAGGIAHEFNNILAIMMGSADLLREGLCDEEAVARRAEDIITAGLRGKDIVDQMLTFSDQRRDDLPIRPLDIKATVRSGLQLVRPTMPANIETAFEADEDTWSVAGNETQIHQVLVNLCTNASDAIAPGPGRIRIRVRNAAMTSALQRRFPAAAQGRYVLVEVQDDGCGIPPDDIPRIFDPYFSTKFQAGGAGIGLSIVTNIMRRHNGAVAVDSDPGHGTTISALFPATQAKAPAAAPAAVPGPKGVERILLVDDEPLIVEVQARYLELLGYTVTGISDPQDAQRMFCESPGRFDLVITDMMMPLVTGLDLAAAVRELRPDVPIILCSGFHDISSDNNEYDHLVDALAAKPTAGVALARLVRQVLDKRGTGA